MGKGRPLPAHFGFIQRCFCFLTRVAEAAHFTGYVTSAEREISYELNFKDDLEGYKDFETLILAEEINSGKMVFLCDIFSITG